MKSGLLWSTVLLVTVASLPRQAAAQDSGARKGERISLAGRVVMSDGSPLPGTVPVEKVCGTNRSIEEATSGEGKFYFTIGRDVTAGMVDARSRNPVGAGEREDSFGRTETGGVFAATGRANMDSLGFVDLSACEVRAVVPGYRSSTIQLGRRSVFESPDIGEIVLRPLREGEVADPTVSATSLSAPGKARGALEKGRKEIEKDRPNWGRAAKQFEAAVELHPTYAEAWYELGEVRLRQEKIDEARSAFRKAIEADEQYVKPYPPLTLIELKSGNMEESARLGDKAVQIDFSLAEAHIYRAMAHHSLGRVEQAHESGMAVRNQGAIERFPRICVILGDTFAQQGDFEESARQYRDYLQLEPDSPMAVGVKQRLEQWQAEGLIQAANAP